MYMDQLNKKTFDIERLNNVIRDLDEVCEIWQGQCADEYKMREEVVELYSYAKSLAEEDGKIKDFKLEQSSVFFSYAKEMLDLLSAFVNKVQKSQVTFSDLIKFKLITRDEETNDKKTKECLVILYDAIYRMRMLIKMHALIGDASSSLKHQDFWGCLQQNVLISTVVIELFSVFDNNKIIKILLNLLKNDDRFFDLKLKIGVWKIIVDEYENFRHGLAHKTDRYLVGQVDYQKILDLLDDFESYLNNIHELVLKCPYVSSTFPCENSLPCLGDLKKILDDEKTYNT